MSSHIHLCEPIGAWDGGMRVSLRPLLHGQHSVARAGQQGRHSSRGVRMNCKTPMEKQGGICLNAKYEGD